MWVSFNKSFLSLMLLHSWSEKAIFTFSKPKFIYKNGRRMNTVHLNEGLNDSGFIPTCRVTQVVEYLGWVDLDLGSSPGWWAATVATFCPGRMVEHPKSKSTQPRYSTTRVTLYLGKRGSNLRQSLPKKLPYSKYVGKLYLFRILLSCLVIWKLKSSLRFMNTNKIRPLVNSGSNSFEILVA